MSKPAIEGRGYEEVIAENASLRAQLKAALFGPRSQSAGVARRPAPEGNGSAGSRGMAHTAVAVGGTTTLAARVRLLEAFVSRSDVTDR